MWSVLTTWQYMLKLLSWIKPLIFLYMLPYNYNKNVLKRVKKWIRVLQFLAHPWGIWYEKEIFNMLHCADFLHMVILYFSWKTNSEVQWQRRPLDNLTQIRDNDSLLQSLGVLKYIGTFWIYNTIPGFT